MERIFEAVRDAIGPDRQALELTTFNVCMRAIVVFIAGLAIMRISNRRFLGKATTFDVLLGFLLGSALSRAISGTAAFLPTLAGCLTIVLLHRVLATLVYFAPGLGTIVRGRSMRVLTEGAVNLEAARKLRLSEGDLHEAIRMHGLSTIEEAKTATLELNGTVSVVPRIIRVEPVSLAGAGAKKRVSIEIEFA